MTDPNAPNQPENARRRTSAAMMLGLGAGLVALPIAAFRQAPGEAPEREKDATNPPAQGITHEDVARRPVDPALVKYREATRIETGLAAPRAVAVDGEGNLLVGGDKGLRRISAAGIRQSDIALSDAPRAVAVAADGTIYVGFKDHVGVYSAQGRRTASWKSLGAGSHITCIAVGAKDVYVADAGRRVVVRYDPAGNVINELARKDESLGIPGLQVPSPHLDVAVAPDGMVWIANPGLHRLEGYTPDGRLERFWGEAGSALGAFFGCCNPANFTLLPDGRFVTAEKSLPRVKVYSADGQFESVVATQQILGENRAGFDVAADARGRVLVLDGATRAIRVFVRDQEQTR